MIALGIDLVEISRFQKTIENGDFLQRCFCETEIEYYMRTNKITFLAGRFAVKEAVVKALGTGLIEGLSLTDIQTIRADSGAPKIVLKDKALELALNLGITRWLVSVTHTQNYASAIVFAE